jgi:hypothetical protein
LINFMDRRTALKALGGAVAVPPALAFPPSPPRHPAESELRAAVIAFRATMDRVSALDDLNSIPPPGKTDADLDAEMDVALEAMDAAEEVLTDLLMEHRVACVVHGGRVYAFTTLDVSNGWYDYPKLMTVVNAGTIVHL